MSFTVCGMYQVPGTCSDFLKNLFNNSDPKLYLFDSSQHTVYIIHGQAESAIHDTMAVLLYIS